MFLRYFLALCLVAFAFTAVHVHAEDEQEVDERANPAAKVVAKLLGSLFAGAAASCLGEAVSNCKSHWKNPGETLKCGRNFLAANKGRCAAGK